MATQVKIPALGESITEAVLVKWHKADGERVERDEAVCELETDKANVDLPAPEAGVFKRLRDEGATVAIGDVIAEISPADAAAAATSGSVEAPTEEKHGEVGADRKALPVPDRAGPVASPRPETPVRAPEPLPRTTPAAPPPQPPSARVLASPASTASSAAGEEEGTRREPLSRIRKRIAERLVSAQHNAAILTTFNEVDMKAIQDLRQRLKERFNEVHGVGLGLMSFFVKACVQAIQEFPRVNAFIEEDQVIYHDYAHLGIAVSTDRGLAVPVLRHAERMSFAAVETEIRRLATAARDGKLAIEELSGGTFTITNGGVFGSLLSTPILNPPQSAILGMHTIQKRPVAVEDRVEIRPMMYLALSYDHRLIDGRESVSFLVRLKQLLEDPTRLMLGV